jgi:hypothetical protein
MGMRVGKPARADHKAQSRTRLARKAGSDDMPVRGVEDFARWMLSVRQENGIPVHMPYDSPALTEALSAALRAGEDGAA